jgi:hypothetical protein
MAGFTNSEEVFDALTKTLGRMTKEVTKWKVVNTDDPVIPKVEGEHILIDLSEADQINWKTNEAMIDGKYVAVHNYLVTYTLTAYRGKPQVALSRLLQAFGLPFIYDKYFPTGSPWAFSSSSSVTRMRVPINMQDFERRARVQLMFNVTFVEVDTGEFEDLEQIQMQVTMHDPVVAREIPVEVDLNNPPNDPPAAG